MPLTAPYFFTSANAREMAAKSWANRAPRPPRTAIVRIAPEHEHAIDPLTEDLARAMKETLKDYRTANDPKAQAMLAQALRNLRETYHLVTGQPRPGQIKSVAPRTRTQSYPSPEVIPEPIAIEAQVSSVPMARPNAGCGPVQAPVPVQPSPTVAVNAPALPEPTDLTP
jgi:hypothetical protein